MHARLHRPGSTQGIALIIVMMVIFVLSLLAAGLSYSMKVEMRLAQNNDAEAELLWLGRSGVELGCWYLAAKNQDPSQAGFDALSQRWAGGPNGTNEPITGLSLEHSELGRGSFSVVIVDLERRFNINFVIPETLERAMELLGYPALAADTVLDSLEDWRDPDDVTRLHGAESDDYQMMSPPYRAKNGLLDDISELLMVRGVTPAMYWGSRSREHLRPSAWLRAAEGRAVGPREVPSTGPGLRDLFNTLGGRRININTASREVLQLLPGMNENWAEQIVRERAGLDQIEGTEDDTPFAAPDELINVGALPPQYVQALRRFCATTSETFEIRVRARVGQYERTYVAIVKRIPAGGVGARFQTLQTYWE